MVQAEGMRIIFVDKPLEENMPENMKLYQELEKRRSKYKDEICKYAAAVLRS